MNLQDIKDRMQELSEQMISESITVDPHQLHLDYRCGTVFFIGPDFIALFAHNDRTLQYYGGFEYVDSSYRFALGDYVFYSIEDQRVNDHWSHAMDAIEERKNGS